MSGGVRLTEAQYEEVMAALFEARDMAANLGDQGADIATRIEGAYETLEGEHYPSEVERDDLHIGKNYKPGHSSDFPF